MELYKKYRPKTFKQMKGNRNALQGLMGFFKKKEVPHFILLTGNSGTGKTTVARVIREKLDCGDLDYKELNTADFRGIEMVRDIRSKIHLSPVNGKTRIWLIDEAHGLTKDAMQAFLKILEDTPEHVYFIFATTDPQKLLPTIRTRATEIKLSSLNSSQMMELLTWVEAGEGLEITEDVNEKIITVAEGSPRKALVILNQIMGISDEDKQLEMIEGSKYEEEAISIARGLLDPKMTWTEMANILKGIEGLPDQAESIRWLVLSYMSSVALNNPRMAKKAVLIIDCFSETFWNTKQAGLITACHEVLTGE